MPDQAKPTKLEKKVAEYIAVLGPLGNDFAKIKAVIDAIED